MIKNDLSGFSVLMQPGLSEQYVKSVDMDCASYVSSTHGEIGDVTGSKNMSSSWH